MNDILEAYGKKGLGSFIANYADPIIAHVNPMKLKDNNLLVVVNPDKTIAVTRLDSGELSNSELTTIPSGNIKKKMSPLLKNICYFQIQKGEYHGTYIISENILKNDQFPDEKSYLKFITQ